MTSLDSFKARKTLTVGGKAYVYFSLAAAEKNGLKGASKLPYSLKVLLENLLRYEDGKTVTADDIKAVVGWLDKRSSEREIAFRPARVLMQDLTGVPAVVDLAAMRDAMKNLGGDPEKINPLAEVDLVIDHSVMVDNFGGRDSFKKNVVIEYERNAERYQFLRWGQQAFANFRVVPPGTGICHQVNLEYLAQTVWTRKDKDAKGKAVDIAFPDTLVGTDSHTTMVNGLSVLGWGVGGIEAEAAMLGQPISMLIPEVIGFKMTGKLREGVTATDLVLTVTQMLRKKGVVGKFVEYYGPGLEDMSLEDRATIANMAPEYGATCGFFPVDAETLRYLKETARKSARVALVEKYAKAQGLFRTTKSEDPVFTDTLELDLSTVEPSLAGPARPQDRVPLDKAADEFASALINTYKKEAEANKRGKIEGTEHSIGHGDVVIAAITSCTNTSNPSVMIGAGLVAEKAVKRGLKVRPWVKTSLAPGSQVVTDYLAKAGLDKALDKLGFQLVGYGCTTCIGNSGPLPDNVSDAITNNDLVTAAVLSGNRNFEGRVHPLVRANYLASPMLVVAYALAGSININLTRDPVGYDRDQEPVYLKDIWPSSKEIAAAMRKGIKTSSFKKRYGDVFLGDTNWRKVRAPKTQTYNWPMGSTYVKNPPFFEGMTIEPKPVKEVKNARILALFGDSITTDHISPAGNIRATAPAGVYLQEHQVRQQDFNSYGARRGNFELMERGTFANIRIKNEMMGGKEGGNTIYYSEGSPSGTEMSIFDAAAKYKADGIDTVIVGGKEYGTGSSRDWAAKGPKLLGVRAVITESFERIHRSNLIGMGVAPLVFAEGKTRRDYALTGREAIDIPGLSSDIKPQMKITATVHYPDAKTAQMPLFLMILTADEVSYYKNGGILPYVLRNLVAA
ncbi:MAG: aconitate hydratase AcnA [Alphaproteobacteria bacterium]|nr:aconitate hydratase AcnA [Alphaproteobacteria bacterium]MBL7097476.1 aconitate hydratase AcnA [Alphaproteobacteria bacterium]